MLKFSKILIANRGEIAVRIIRSARKLNIRTVAVYAEDDFDSLHVSMADEIHCLGNGNLSETYLNIEKIIEIAVKSGCDALHPGYGFLSENHRLIDACNSVGIVFIGPHSEAVLLMGNKIESREYVRKIGVPLIKGITGNIENLIWQSDEIPFPVLIKAASGGGGKGMRIVRKFEDLKPALEATSREAKSYFGDETVYIEQYVENPRHIEVQILGDKHGNVLHLFERECSVQRRYQKIIEEAPSPTLSPEIRKNICETAVKIAREIKYDSAGTIEFLLDENQNFYFLEMNTRIQVEHSVTEMTTDADLVSEQILIAAGNPISFTQQDLKQNGHAVECRIYAEDPENEFLPSPGILCFYSEPQGNEIRIDTGITAETLIKSSYDPMIGKLIVHAENRKAACEKMISALENYHIHGIKTNISYLISLIKHQDFQKNNISVKFCETETPSILKKFSADKSEIDKTIPLAAFLIFSMMKNHIEKENIWKEIGYWRNLMKLDFYFENNIRTVEISDKNSTLINFIFENKKYSANVERFRENKIDFILDDKFYSAAVSQDKSGFVWISVSGFIFKMKRKDFLPYDSQNNSDENDSHASDTVFSPMPGKVIKILVRSGDEVKKGDILLIVEAMKTENRITATKAGKIAEIRTKENENVGVNKVLVTYEK
jgi:acetyl-CoA carboxylase biotin carboxylase subunit